MSPGALYSRRVKVAANPMSLPHTTTRWRTIPSHFWTRTFSMDFDLRPSFRYSFALWSRTFSLSESVSL